MHLLTYIPALAAVLLLFCVGCERGLLSLRLNVVGARMRDRRRRGERALIWSEQERMEAAARVFSSRLETCLLFSSNKREYSLRVRFHASNQFTQISDTLEATRTPGTYSNSKK